MHKAIGLIEQFCPLSYCLSNVFIKENHMKKFIVLLGVAVLFNTAQVLAADTPSYGSLYNIEWCPCNPEEPFDEKGSVVMGKTIMCPCNSLYSGYKKGFDEDIRDIKRAANNQLRKLNYFKYYVGFDYNIAKQSASSSDLTFDDIRFADSPISINTNGIIDDQDNISFVLGARVNKYWGLEAFYQMSYKDNKVSQVDQRVINNPDYYTINDYLTKYKAYGVDFVGYLPMSQFFDFLASVGVAQYKFENSATFGVFHIDNTDLDAIINQNFNDDKIGWRFAVGGQLNIAEGVALRAMYRYITLGGDVVDDMKEFSFGVRFLF